MDDRHFVSVICWNYKSMFVCRFFELIERDASIFISFLMDNIKGRFKGSHVFLFISRLFCSTVDVHHSFHPSCRLIHPSVVLFPSNHTQCRTFPSNYFSVPYYLYIETYVCTFSLVPGTELSSISVRLTKRVQSTMN